MKFKVVLVQSEDGGYTVYIPALPGCISQGDSREEALANIREALQLYLEPVEGDIAQEGNVEIVDLPLWTGRPCCPTGRSPGP